MDMSGLLQAVGEDVLLFFVLIVILILIAFPWGRGTAI